jgi:hypothetical protein
MCAVLFVLSGCGKLQDIRPTSFELSSISPKGLSAAEMDFRIGIHNPVMQISLSDIFAEVVVSGKVIGNVSVSPFVLEAKSDKEYDMKALFALSKGTSILNLIPLLKDPQAHKDAVMNVRFKAALKGGLAKELRWDGIPLEKLMKLADR